MCPVCGNKTRLKIREDTELKKFPLYCPKCRQENLIEIKQFKVTVITEARRKDAEPMKMRLIQSQFYPALSVMYGFFLISSSMFLASLIPLAKDSIKDSSLSVKLSMYFSICNSSGAFYQVISR